MIKKQKLFKQKYILFQICPKIVTFYNIDQEKKILINDLKIPIKFCSIKKNDGRMLITGGAKNTSKSSNQGKKEHYQK